MKLQRILLWCSGGSTGLDDVSQLPHNQLLKMTASKLLPADVLGWNAKFSTVFTRLSRKCICNRLEMWNMHIIISIELQTSSRLIKIRFRSRTHRIPLLIENKHGKEYLSRDFGLLVPDSRCGRKIMLVSFQHNINFLWIKNYRPI
jgi:hypothetical protein